jgi:hypothetical protein
LLLFLLMCREAIETALREGKPILMDELRLPQGSPI